MSREAYLTLRCDEDGVARLTMADVQRRNALSAPFVARLEELLAKLGDDPRAKVCVLEGTEDVFCSGGDKQMLVDLASGKVAATDIMISRALLEVPVPTIAAMTGHAVGGGLTLGLCCDIVLMARESRYGCSFMNMGFTPGMGTTQLLELAVGPFVAAEMMFGGKMFRGSHFESRAGVNYVLPRAKLAGRAYDIARRIAEKPRASLLLLKRELSLAKRQRFEQARTSEAFMHELSFALPETRALIEEGYLEGRNG